MVIPPFLFYAVGGMLVALGALRAYHLGWRGREDDEDKRRRTSRKRHLFWGVLWMAMGGYVVFTAVSLQRRLAESAREDVSPGDGIRVIRAAPDVASRPGARLHAPTTGSPAPLRADAGS